MGRTSSIIYHAVRVRREHAIGLVQVPSKSAAATKIVCRIVESQKASGE